MGGMSSADAEAWQELPPSRDVFVLLRSSSVSKRESNRWTLTLVLLGRFRRVALEVVRHVLQFGVQGGSLTQSVSGA